MNKCTKNHTNAVKREDVKLLTLEEKKQLQYGDHCYTEALCGCLLRFKVNGQPKTWKRNPERVAIPFKYGMYEYGYLTERDSIYKYATS